MELRSRFVVAHTRAVGEAGGAFRLAVLRPPDGEMAEGGPPGWRLLGELVLAADDPAAEPLRAGDALEVTITLRRAGD